MYEKNVPKNLSHPAAISRSDSFIGNEEERDVEGGDLEGGDVEGGDVEEGNEEDGEQLNVEKEQVRDVHIHLQNLLDFSTLKYLLEEIPWGELFAANRLSRVVQEKYITEHIVRETDKKQVYDHAGVTAEGGYNARWRNVGQRGFKEHEKKKTRRPPK